MASDSARLFPSTRASLLSDVRADDPAVRVRSFDLLVRTYYRPVYVHLRLQWSTSREDAEELTQEFFTRAYEKHFFDAFDPRKAKFRTFVKVCVDRLVLDLRKSAGRLKRGSGARAFSLDFGVAESEVALMSSAGTEAVELAFHHAWVKSLLALAVEDLELAFRVSKRQKHFEVFRKLVLDVEDGDKPSYAQAAAEIGISVSDVTNYLFIARREFRACVVSRLRELTPNEEEFRSEMAAVLGVRLVA